MIFIVIEVFIVFMIFKIFKIFVGFYRFLKPQINGNRDPSSVAVSCSKDHGGLGGKPGFVGRQTHGGLLGTKSSQVKLLLPKFHRADSALRSQAAGGVGVCAHEVEGLNGTSTGFGTWSTESTKR